MKRTPITLLILAGAMMAPMPASYAASSAYDQATQLELDGMDLQQKGDLDGAIAKYRQAVQLYPKDNAFHQNLAQALNDAGAAKYRAKDYPGAIADFQEALANAPNFDRAKTNLSIAEGDVLNDQGMAMFKNGDFAGAVQKFDAALVAEPGFKSATVNRDAAEAEIAMKAGDPATAVAKLQEAVSIAPTPFLQDHLAKAQAALAAQQAEKEKDKDQPKSN